jgi:DNA-binding NarL/FixJ family response regulator/class 3 adenylate cyclase
MCEITFKRHVVRVATGGLAMSSNFPSGTVTFLFTDIEGSTKLWEQHPQEMLVAHAHHNQILREAIESNNGYVFQVIGDAFCAAFLIAGEAIRAAIKTQMDLKAVNWECTPIKVRIGIHTGKAELQKADGLYAGYITLSRVQRLMSAGCGGQVLVSFATQELVHHDLPTDVELDDLGKWHLKNLSHPEHIYQLKITGLPCEFPSLRKNLLKDSSMDTIRLLIADDHALFREGLRALFSALPDIEVVGEAADGATAITQVDACKPDVVLMDINMPGVNGIEATRRILSDHPQLGVIMVTMLEDDASVFAAMRAGARGYVLKGAHHDEILQAIRAVAAGQAVFGPAIAVRMMNFFQGLNSAPQTGGPVTAFPELTEREREVLKLMAQGVSNKAIAEKLVISMKTVSNHITNIFSKLQVADRAQAILRARDAGMG